MSSGLMSCVRENSPPIDMHGHASGPMSLPESNMTSTPLTAMTAINDSSGGNSGGSGGGGGSSSGPTPTTEPKRRRFHPLRNLRRIFRRRTITSVNDTPTSTLPPTSSTSEKNLRSATLSSISSVVSASSPSSPLTHQQLQDAYSSQSLPKSKSYSCTSSGSGSGGGGGSGSSRPLRDVLLGAAGKHKHKEKKDAAAFKDIDMYTTTSSVYQQHHHHHTHRNGSGVGGGGGGANGGGGGSGGSGLYQAQQRQSLGVAVLPSAMSRSFYAERQKLRSVGDSSQDLDSSGHESGSNTGGMTTISTHGGGLSGRANGSASGGEMTDSQRSLSEGRLVDSDYSHEQLSQSHDSVFSESATASSLSIVLKAELADVLRKRRNRPDASDEDLGLPRSPQSPQRRTEHYHSATTTTTTTTTNNNNTTTTTSSSYGGGGGGHNNPTSTPTIAGNHSEVSSLSLLSMNSADGDDILAASTANNSIVIGTGETGIQERSTSSVGRYLRSSTLTTSSSLSSDIYRHSMGSSFGETTKDEVDLFSSNWQRLSHSAAKHKMAVRPTKKKGPSRNHRRTLETSIPEANEDILKYNAGHSLDLADLDIKTRTRSLPPGVNAKALEHHTDEKKDRKATILSPTSNTAATKSSHTKASGDDITLATNKRTRMEKSETEVDKIITTSSVTSATSTSTSLFGLRALSAKATSMFESKEPEAELKKKEREKEPLESNDSGFLRRLITRNSKRSIAKATGGEDDTDMNHQSEPKKLQISASCFEVKSQSSINNLVTLEKSRSEMSYEQNIEETRKEIKREIKSVGSMGLSAMMNTYRLSPDDVPSEICSTSLKEHSSTTATKPKSGPAARQRYMPQDLSTLERKSTSVSASSLTTSKDSALNALPKPPGDEVFQSTSIIREITASQASSNSSITTSKSEHHFEKKPKIVGLSAFQQKISRSNDSFMRTSSTSTSDNSLETSGEAIFITYDEPKQRKSVEKSRSFRTYTEDRDSPAASVHNNMPSLPDLSLNLRVPNFGEFILQEKDYSSPSPPDAHDKSTSLGFEINDNNLMKSTSRAESTGHLPTTKKGGNYSKNIILTTTAGNLKTTPTKLLTPSTVVPNLSPTSNRNISEIEQNIDLIMKSPFISVLRKSTSINEDGTSKTPTLSLSVKKVEDEDSPEKSQVEIEKLEKSEKSRPKHLYFKEKTANEEKVTSTPSPVTQVHLREKPPTAAASSKVGKREVEKSETERKSVPLVNERHKTNSFKSMSRRSSSIVDHLSHEGASDEADVPEFMKIQLNRVDPTRTAKTNVVLAKNVKESSEPEKSASTDDLSLRRLSNESVEITEKETPETEKRISGVFEAINRQTKSISTSSIRNSCELLPPKSPSKKSNPLAGTPPSPGNGTDTEAVVVLRTKSNEQIDPTIMASNKLSLVERKRLFMNEEKLKAEKKVEELRKERKKSINEEVYRKSIKMADEKSENDDKTNTPAAPAATEGNVVVLRKKSFSNIAASTSPTNPLNGHSNSQSSNNTAPINKDDSTPELMKVFARRSLKIKDEDLSPLIEKLPPHTPHTTPIHSMNSEKVPIVKKFTTPANTANTVNAVNMDSDKENQSSSEEKLDKLPKSEMTNAGIDHHHHHHLHHHHHNHNHNATTAITPGMAVTITMTIPLNGGKIATNSPSNRNSLADFRNCLTKTNGLTVSNGNNNNNNNNSALVTTTTTTISGGKNSLPPLKASGFRSMERNSSISKLYHISGGSSGGNGGGVGGIGNESTNNNGNLSNNHNSNQNNNNSNAGKSPHERQSLRSVDTITSISPSAISVNSNVSKTIERSATVSEFKGIHQRRAEWEQRAKEALK